MLLCAIGSIYIENRDQRKTAIQAFGRSHDAHARPVNARARTDWAVSRVTILVSKGQHGRRVVVDDGGWWAVMVAAKAKMRSRKLDGVEVHACNRVRVRLVWDVCTHNGSSLTVCELEFCPISSDSMSPKIESFVYLAWNATGPMCPLVLWSFGMSMSIACIKFA